MIIKNTIFLFFFISSSYIAQEELFNRKYSISFNNVKIEDALNQLQNLTDIPFAFNNNLESMEEEVNGVFENKTLKNIFNSIFKDKPLSYKIIANQVIIYPKNMEGTKDSNHSSIKGRVINKITQKPISMINVAILGSVRGTVTNNDGDFIINNLSAGKYDLIISSIGYKSQKFKQLDVSNNNSLDLGVISFKESEITLEEIVITPGSFSIMSPEPLSRQTLNMEEFKNMSFSEDITRAVSRLPGISSNDFSSKFSIRGGESDEVLITLDGMELYDPFHQRDFSGGLFSIVDIEAIEGINLFTGGFSAEYGQRQSGVFNMKSKSIKNSRFSSVGLSIINARIYTEGKFNDNRISYLISARRGMLDQTFKLIDETENIPIYYDLFGKIEYILNDKHTFSVHGLQAADKTEVRDAVPGETDFDIHDTWYNNSYAWITLHSVYNPYIYSRNILYSGIITHHRHGSAYKQGLSDKVKFNLIDKRRLDYWGFKQDWNWKANKNIMIKGGFDFKQLFSSYNYSISLSDLRVNSLGSVGEYFQNQQINQKPKGNQLGIYFTPSFSLLPNLFFEPGFRIDYTSYTSEDHFSPRIGIVYALSNRTFLRGAWGYYYQSQFIYNKEVNYGVEDFRKAELAKHYILGLEHTFSNGLNLRLEGYVKDISLPIINFRNLRDQWEVFPEVRNDVVKLNISKARTHGIELFLKYDMGKTISWWFSYAFSKAEEKIESIEFEGILEKKTGWLPRINNQNHTIYSDINYRFGKNWVFNLSWQYWNGWPITLYEYDYTTIANEELHFFPEHTEFQGEKYPDYHRLDLRINYHFEISLGKISAYLHLINLYNKENLRKFDLDVTNDEEELVSDGIGGYKYFRDDKFWFGLTPVLGLSLEF